MRPVITSVKHYVQITQTAVAALASANNNVISAVARADLTAVNAQEVAQGSLVKAVFLEFWVLGDEDANAHSTFQFAITKLSGSDAGLTFAEMNALHGYDNKKNVLLFSQGIVGGDLSNPTPVIRQWIKIPKGKQRFGLLDRLAVTFTGLTGDIIFCGFVTFKEYT